MQVRVVWGERGIRGSSLSRPCPDARAHQSRTWRRDGRIGASDAGDERRSECVGAAVAVPEQPAVRSSSLVKGGDVEVRGRVLASDGARGSPCQIEINSAAAPFYSPILLDVKIGEKFKHTMSGSEAANGLYAAVRCEGFSSSVLRTSVVSFDLVPGRDVDLHDVVLTRAGR